MTDKQITYSAELMSNFKPVEVMAPEKKFEALQTDDGCSLLFSIGTDDVFYVTQETHEHETGWVKTNLSETVLAKHSGGTVKTFSVAQNSKTHKIDMALVVTTPRTDYLYLSLGNASDNTAWVQQPQWVQVVSSLPRIVVVNVFLSQASDGEYIVVDVSRNPEDTVQYVRRYYINTDATKLHNGEAWELHDVPVDLDISRYRSCLGRRQGQRVDGIYTLGEIGQHNTLSYQPLHSNNPNNPTPPNPVRLILPQGAASPSALASVRVNGGNATDLYVACRQTLYYFAHDKQHDLEEGVKILEHPLFEDVSRLFAFATDKKVIIWGLNRAQQIFYTTCDHTQIQSPQAWSYSLPLLENVEQVSPYVNCVDDGHVFFAHTGNGQLQKAVQSPATTTWKFDSILLPALPTAKATKFSSYTTRIQVTNKNNQPLSNPTPPAPKNAEEVVVHLSAAHRVGLYINNRYYILTTQPIPVKVDAAGALMIVEWVNNLEATILYVHREDGSRIKINPMEKPLQKAAQLDSEAKLAQANILKPDGSVEKPLISPTIDQDKRQGVVQSIQHLANAYTSLPKEEATTAIARNVVSRADVFAAMPSHNVVSLAVSGTSVQRVSYDQSRLPAMGIAEEIEVLWGDFVRWLQSVTDYVIHFIEDTATKVWHFIVEIAGKVYRFVLDAVEKVVGALEAIFNALKTAIEDVIKYLSFLFEWKDFVRTKDVFKKLLLLSATRMVEDIDDLKGQFDTLIAQATGTLDDWAGLTKMDQWTRGINDNQPAGHRLATADLQAMHSAPANFLSHHLSANAQNSRFLDPVSGAGGDLSDLIDKAFQAFEAEKDVLEELVQEIRTQVIDKFASFPLGDVLKHLMAILLKALLKTTQVVGDLLIDLFAQLLRSAMAVLDAKIHIPVLSDILEDVFGIQPFSILDVICLIGAVPATIIYKIARNAAPFSPHDGFSEKILNAKDLSALQEAFRAHNSNPGPRHVMMAAASAATPVLTAGKTNFTPIQLTPEVQHIIFKTGHLVSGVIGGILLPFVAAGDVMFEDIYTTGPNPWSTWAALAGIATAATAFLPRIFAEPNPIQNEVMSSLSAIAGGSTFVSKVIHGGVSLGYERIRSDRATGMMVTKIGSAWDCVFAIVGLIPSSYHFYELSQQPKSSDRDAAIIGETSNVCNYLARIAEFSARIDPEEVSKAVLVGGMGILYVAYGGLQVVEALVA